MSANNVQVGGDHYKADYQHWDYVIRGLRNRYLEGQVTKYVTRHRKKNGLEDVQKALHYCDKLLEEYRAERVPCIFNGVVNFEPENFCKANNLTGLERAICIEISRWSSEHQLLRVRELIESLVLSYAGPSQTT